MRQCSFCGADESEEYPLIKGSQDANICCNCILSAYEILFGDVAPSEAKKTSEVDVEYENESDRKSVDKC